jgi:hypothetical protein
MDYPATKRDVEIAINRIMAKLEANRIEAKEQIEAVEEGLLMALRKVERKLKDD